MESKYRDKLKSFDEAIGIVDIFKNADMDNFNPSITDLNYNDVDIVDMFKNAGKDKLKERSGAELIKLEWSTETDLEVSYLDGLNAYNDSIRLSNKHVADEKEHLNIEEGKRANGIHNDVYKARESLRQLERFNRILKEDRQKHIETEG